jgi:hypothetical protein
MGLGRLFVLTIVEGSRGEILGASWVCRSKRGGSGRGGPGAGGDSDGMGRGTLSVASCGRALGASPPANGIGGHRCNIGESPPAAPRLRADVAERFKKGA